MTTTVCYPANGGNQRTSPPGLAPYDETSSSSSSSSLSLPSSPASEHHQRSPTGLFGVQTHGVEETEALAKGATGRKRTRASGRGRFPLLGGGGRGKRRRLRSSSGGGGGESSIIKTTDITTTTSGRAKVRPLKNDMTGRERPKTSRRNPAETEKVPRLPHLCFPEFGLMMKEAGISATIEGSASTSVHEEDIGVEASSNESVLSKDRSPGCLLGLRDNDDTGSQEGPKKPTKDGLGIHRPASVDFEGRRMDEEEEAPHGVSYDIPRPTTGLGWYEDDASSVKSTVDHFDSQSSVRDSDGSAESIALDSQPLAVHQDPLRCSPFIRCCSQASSLPEVGGTPTTESKHNKLSPSMSTVMKNTSSFLRFSTDDDDDDDDDWLGPRPVESGSVSHQHIEYSPAHAEPSSNSIMEDSNTVSPISHKPFSISEEEQEIDDIIDIYATSPDRTPVQYSGDLPPYPPYHHYASDPLRTIARGLSLPPTTSFADLQEYLARNANILRYLVLHCIPSPSINPIEYVTDLVEPILPLPLPPHPSIAQNYPPHPRRREYTGLLQAVRSVQWSADVINDMLAVVDSDPSPPGSRGRRSTALPMFRKLRAADAQRKGHLTSAQLHRLHRHGVSLLDVLQMNDVPKVVARGLSERLMEAAESGVLEIAKEGNLLDEEGALLELLVDPGDTVPTSPRGERRGRRREGSGLRNCVGADEDDGETTDDENEYYEAGTAVESLFEHADDGRNVDDMWYTVSPLSPDANPDEHGWNHDDVSPLTTSCRLQELEALFHEVRVLSSEKTRPADGTTPEPPRKAIRRTRVLRTCGDRGGVLVDEETAKSPEMQRFFHVIGAPPPPADPDSRLAKGGRRSWGVDLGGILSA
ncbi:uncharacterized protein GLRG_04522 [Colletotrichum graminicola M1.001]|uniref:Uncharacterized protein n=1 Tax=Colletotrichum graminicola (strain M1.001 / M2 / FGSC 10212) TaxID=645133 RepID=E3QES2_COLGM|nr:uncharacterized protein GLRG_04522 [Colletotrichum graminicola M1.001]EFQ29378.1 hypothetical protein GLRG_04522 [Colletotrichum graminicola M1.001]